MAPFAKMPNKCRGSQPDLAKAGKPLPDQWGSSCALAAVPIPPAGRGCAGTRRDTSGDSSMSDPITHATRIRHLREALIAIEERVVTTSPAWPLAVDALRDDDIAAEEQDEQSREERE